VGRLLDENSALTMGIVRVPLRRIWDALAEWLDPATAQWTGTVAKDRDATLVMVARTGQEPWRARVAGTDDAATWTAVRLIASRISIETAGADSPTKVPEALVKFFTALELANQDPPKLDDARAALISALRCDPLFWQARLRLVEVARRLGELNLSGELLKQVKAEGKADALTVQYQEALISACYQRADAGWISPRTCRTVKIVSLLPSATEIVCALGAADELVGISHECDFPDSIRSRKVLTRSRIAAEGSSRSIDTAVREVIHNALSIYAIDDAALGALQPDVIVTQDLCEVCAVSLDDVRAAVARLSHREAVRIVSLRPTRLFDILDDVERVAAGIGREAVGKTVRAALEARMHAIAARAAKAVSKPCVASLEWMEPLMLGGTWMPELIELAGGVAAGASAGEPAPTIDGGQLRALRPEVIVAKPCGFSMQRALSEEALLARAVTGIDARVYVTDGNAFFNRPGPRIVESLEIMAACVHPELFEDFAGKHASVITRWHGARREA
jgi:iron complex transport system substrate-binding protein